MCWTTCCQGVSLQCCRTREYCICTSFCPHHASSAGWQVWLPDTGDAWPCLSWPFPFHSLVTETTASDQHGPSNPTHGQHAGIVPNHALPVPYQWGQRTTWNGCAVGEGEQDDAGPHRGYTGLYSCHTLSILDCPQPQIYLRLHPPPSPAANQGIPEVGMIAGLTRGISAAD